VLSNTSTVRGAAAGAGLPKDESGLTIVTSSPPKASAWQAGHGCLMSLRYGIHRASHRWRTGCRRSAVPCRGRCNGAHPPYRSPIL